MFSVMPSQTFGDASLYRPAVSSPLSSSPIRPSSPPPLFSHESSSPPAMRQTQSSPIQPSPTFRYAARPTRPNPAVQKREDAQKSRRQLFLKNVRQRADEKKWERRGGDQELLRLEWVSLNRDLQRAKNADADGFVGADEAEIEELLLLQPQPGPRPVEGGDDEMMVDAIAQAEEAELEALISSFPTDPSSSDPMQRPESPHFSDDEDYDALFMDYLSQEQESTHDEMDLH